MGTEILTTIGHAAGRDVSKAIYPFSATLARHGLELTRGKTTVLQLNVGFLCNQVCKHCHLEAGPERREVMDLSTVRQVVAFAQRGAFQVIDITGGAPELNPNLAKMIEWFSDVAGRLMIRSNLTSLCEGEREFLMELCKRKRVVIVGSLPSANPSQLEAQRGKGVFRKSVDALQRLNSIGYGQPGSGLQLDLVCNPTGAFLPVPQDKAEKKFRSDLQRKWGIVFNNLYTFANAPLGRFRRWLVESGNYDQYMQRLVSSFNPCTVPGLMCRTLISVSWDGYLYDCDFNQAKDLPSGGLKRHVSESGGPPVPGTPIAVSDHCYACTAGAGFT